MPSELVDPGPRVSARALKELRATVQGSVIEPHDAEFRAATAIWNRAAQRDPALLVRCVNAGDVAAAVRFAQSEELPLAVRGGGYSPAGQSAGAGVVVDLRPMQAVHVDPLGKTVVVGAGATWGVVDAATQRFGYAVPGVPVAAIGVAGSTIGGGFGHLRRAYGLACDNLMGADLITAEGELLVTSGDNYPELLWGLRGGGGNFGILTSLRFQLRPLPEPVLSGPVVWSARHTVAVLQFYRDYTARLRDDVTTRLSLGGVAPAGPFTPVRRNGTDESVVSITVACVGHPVDAQRLVRPVRSVAEPLVDGLAPQPYVRLQSSVDYAPGQFAAMTSMYVDELDDDLVKVLDEQRDAMPSGSCEMHVHHMGGAVGRVARMSTAVPNRATRYLVSAMARWAAPDDAESHQRWLAATGERLKAVAVGGPHVGMQSGPVSSIEAYGAERYLRLAALKRRFDPDNFFLANQNVAPLA